MKQSDEDNRSDSFQGFDIEYDIKYDVKYNYGRWSIHEFGEELQKPRDEHVATPRGESAKNEVIRLRQMLFRQQRTERLKCAVMGGMLCDAASSTLLWHYDVEKLKELVGDKEPFFFPKEHLCPYLKPMVEAGHYDKPSSLSPFGEQNLMFIDTIKDVDKTADIDGQAQSDVYYSWAKDFKGYKEMNVKVFEAAYSEGKKYPDFAQTTWWGAG